MIFFKPIPFEAALQSVKAKLILKTKLSEKQVEAMGPKLRRRALVLAKQENARFASQVKGVVESILSGTETDSGARAKLREWLDSTGYEPDKAGTITDLGSNARLTLIIRTETQMAQGYAEWKQGQTASILALWPAQEFYRAEEREEPREWPERWDAAGGQFFGGGGDYEEGRMIALKSDPIWRAISRFDNAWPPFDFNSGMNIRDVDREEAEELGLIQPGEIVVESNEDFDDAPPFPDDLPDDLRRELERELANAFCPTGEGGGIDNSCGGKQWTHEINSGVGAKADALLKMSEAVEDFKRFLNRQSKPRLAANGTREGVIKSWEKRRRAVPKEPTDEWITRGSKKPDPPRFVHRLDASELARLVASKGFKDWFGDSAVKDKDGNPLVVFHGTEGAFSEFDPAKGGKVDAFLGAGHYFTQNSTLASE